MDTGFSIRPATLEDFEAMREIDRAAGVRFADIGMEDVAAKDAPSATLRACINAKRAWVAEADGRRVGYAIARVLDGVGHLQEVSVLPEYGRRGIGRALIQRVIDWARGEGYPALTLLTFRDVPWNGPYYEKLGFRPVPDAQLTPELRVERIHEGEWGLDLSARQAMRLEITPRS
jgi:GNAT superfamily N-acetyltransferase